MDPEAFVRSRGGFARVRDLQAAGLSRNLLTELVADDVLRRPRNGWYSTRDASDPAYRAVALGGRLTGVSAFAEWNAWLPEKPRILHVAVKGKASAVRRVHGVALHWHDERLSGTAWSVGLEDALLRVALDEPLETAVCVFDWAWRSGRLDRVGFESVLAQLPRGMQCLREWVDPNSQSVLESVARVRCLRKGWRVRSQVPVAGTQAIDLVIEDTVALELDGRRFHESTFTADRRKDLAIAIEGRHSLRVDSGLLFGSWPSIERAIERILATRGRRQNFGTPLSSPSGTRVRRRPAPRSSVVPPGGSWEQFGVSGAREAPRFANVLEHVRFAKEPAG